MCSRNPPPPRQAEEHHGGQAGNMYVEQGKRGEMTDKNQEKSRRNKRRKKGDEQSRKQNEILWKKQFTSSEDQSGARQSTEHHSPRDRAVALAAGPRYEKLARAGRVAAEAVAVVDHQDLQWGFGYKRTKRSRQLFAVGRGRVLRAARRLPLSVVLDVVVPRLTRDGCTWGGNTRRGGGGNTRQTTDSKRHEEHKTDLQVKRIGQPRAGQKTSMKFRR